MHIFLLSSPFSILYQIRSGYEENACNYCYYLFILDHSSEELVDLVLTVSEVTAVNVMDGLFAPTCGGVVQLERPQEVTGILLKKIILSLNL